MGKKKGSRIPKRLFGFKLSKGTRKDLRKVQKMLFHPDSRALVMSALGAVSALLAERMAPHHDETDDGTARSARAH